MAASAANRDRAPAPRSLARQEQRGSDSPFVERITQVTYDGAVDEWSTPDGCWDLVVLRRGGGLVVLQTVVISRPVALHNEAGDAYLSISFKPGVFMPRTPGAEMLDRGVVRPIVAARSFRLESETLEIPTFDNADDLVNRMARRGLLARDDLVESVVAGHPRASSPRSLQRHFLHALGLTANQLAQIQRARAAVARLEKGGTPADVAAELGYADQPHLTRALKRIMGQTPGAIAKGPRR